MRWLDYPAHGRDEEPDGRLHVLETRLMLWTGRRWLVWSNAGSYFARSGPDRLPPVFFDDAASIWREELKRLGYPLF